MRVLNLNLGEKSYPIYIGQSVLTKKELLTKHIVGRQVMIVSSKIISSFYISKIKPLLRDYELVELVLKDGEQYKTLDTVNTIFDALIKAKFERSCTLIALGGGVVGDITGFAAASYQRGVNFIQIPTTLLAQVDSSIGGKTGVNHKLAKNMIGAFYQPKCVVIDVNTLDTLDARQYSAGLAEVIKYGLLGSVDFLQYLENNIDDLMACNKALIIEIIYRSCQYKANIVAKDEFETNTRALLNLGHTFAHAIENNLGYGVYLHGEAVGVGMLMAARLSQLEGYLEPCDVDRVKALLVKSNLPTTINGNINFDDFVNTMAMDKKANYGNIRLILLKKLGTAFICSDYKDALLYKVIKEFVL